MKSAIGVNKKKNTIPSMIGVVMRFIINPKRIHPLYTGLSVPGEITPHKVSAPAPIHGHNGYEKLKSHGINSANSTITIVALVNANLRRPLASSSGMFFIDKIEIL